jgi:hypothetical protein
MKLTQCYEQVITAVMNDSHMRPREYIPDPGVRTFEGMQRQERGAEMPTEFVSSHAVMESGGTYNLHARVQARGAGLALPLLESSLQKLELNGEQPITIADYGSSQGKNRLLRCGWLLRCCAPVSVLIGASLWCMSTSRLTTSIPFLTAMWHIYVAHYLYGLHEHTSIA